MMNSPMIDLTPYLPQETVIPQTRKNRRNFTLLEVLEGFVTASLGIGIFFVLAALVAAM